MSFFLCSKFRNAYKYFEYHLFRITAIARADTITYTSETQELFSDFLINFDRVPTTGSLARVTNEDSVNQRIRNIVLTNLLERPYQPGFGSKINAVLFEPMDASSAQSLDTTIRAAIRNNEPAATIVRLDVIPSAQEDSYRIDLYYTMINTQDQVFFAPITISRNR